MWSGGQGPGDTHSGGKGDMQFPPGFGVQPDRAGGKVSLEPGSLDAALAGKVKAQLEGQATLNVMLRVDGPARITGTSLTGSIPNIKTKTGADATGAPTGRFGHN